MKCQILFYEKNLINLSPTESVLIVVNNNFQMSVQKKKKKCATKVYFS